MKLVEQHLRLFHDRFVDFCDGVVCRVDLELYTEQSCSIVIACKDQEQASGWSSVRFEIADVREFRFEIVRTTFVVLSSGIQFAWRDGLVYLVLDAYPDDEAELPDLKKNTAYVAGATCDWSVSEYHRSES